MSDGSSPERMGIRPSMLPTTDRSRSYRSAGFWDARTLTDGVEAAARSFPDRPAVIDNRSSLTWSELCARIDSAVKVMRNLGVKACSPVVLVSGNTVEGVVAYHGLLRMGAPVVVLDRRCGTSDIRYAVEATGAAVVVLPPSEEARLGSAVRGVAVATLERVAGPGDGELEGAVEPDRDAVAVVLFTSGTTRHPKGVLHSFNTLTSAARNMALATGAGSHTVLFLVSPLTSITGIMQMHVAADQHATLVLEDEFSPDRSLDRLNRWGATLLGGAPVVIERLARAAECRPGQSLSLTDVALGGTMLSRELLNRLADKHGIKVCRVYGSSEAPVSTASLPHDGPETRLSDDGAFMPGTDVKVGSARDSREGLLVGPNLFLGYLDPADNDEAFDGEWYRSGDLVETTDRRLTVLGRFGEVVHRNGLKISINEVESALEGLPVDEYACFAVADASTGERLAVAVYRRDGTALGLDVVVDHLRSAGVATRKLPEEVVTWDEPLPRTSSGKVVRSRLAADSGFKRSVVSERVANRPSPPDRA